jgi:hypothetical protein
MDKITVVQNPFKQKGKGVKVYSSKKQPEERPEPEERRQCGCAMCKADRQITREVRGQFNRYGKI